jgi:hypothetical protein
MGFTLEADKTYKEAGIRTRGEHTTLARNSHTQLVHKLVQLQL